MNDYPHALFRYQPDPTCERPAQIVKMNREQFEQAIRDGRICKCGRCACCRAVEYLKDAQEAQR